VFACFTIGSDRLAAVSEARAAYRCPLLIQIAEHDAIVPTGPARKVAATTAGPAELCSYPIEHFDIYLGNWRARAIADQLGFLRRHLT
jgi:hypothetical protein